MNNSDMPAMPVSAEQGLNIDSEIMRPKKYGLPSGMGLTKREYFAGLAMQGFAADKTTQWSSIEQIANSSVTLADALLEELERTK